MTDDFQPPVNPGGFLEATYVEPLSFMLLGALALGACILAGKLAARRRAARRNELPQDARSR